MTRSLLIPRRESQDAPSAPPAGELRLLERARRRLEAFHFAPRPRRVRVRCRRVRYDERMRFVIRRYRENGGAYLPADASPAVSVRA